MGARRWSFSTLAAVLLAVLGVASAAGSVEMARRYVRVAATLGRFESAAEPMVLADGRLGVRIAYRNPGPWPIALLEIQVLAWRDGRYVGAASLDRRANPLEVPPGGSRAVELAFARPAGDPPAVSGVDDVGAWVVQLSGGMQLPVIGPRPFARRTLYPEGTAP
ncbi:MAG: hypothetical protein GX496_10755 [Firmicutes bacterium]|nr:hypothetical protein [Bacillota bacterium]